MGAISMIDIGEKLRQAREKKSLTIDQARKQTRIHSKVLLALEDGKCDDMLNPTYVKSFLRKYSGYLGLDSKEILNEYIALHPEYSAQAIRKLPGAKDHDDYSILDKKTRSRPGKGGLLRFISIVSSAAIVIAVLFLAVFLWKKSAVFINKHKSMKAAQPANYKKPREAARPSKQKKGPKIINLKLKEVSRTEIKKPRAASPGPIPKNMPFNLGLKVKSPVLITLKKDGSTIFKGVMPKDSFESYRANEVINIYVAKAEAIELILNGRSLDIPAKGIIRDLEITRKGVRIK